MRSCEQIAVFVTDLKGADTPDFTLQALAPRYFTEHVPHVTSRKDPAHLPKSVA
jgi:hypothetical protein